MKYILDMSDYLLLLITAGAAMRIVYCLVRMPGSEEDQPMYKKRIKNIVIFVCVASAVWTIAALVLRYLGVSFGAA